MANGAQGGGSGCSKFPLPPTLIWILPAPTAPKDNRAKCGFWQDRLGRFPRLLSATAPFLPGDRFWSRFSTRPMARDYLIAEVLLPLTFPAPISYSMAKRLWLPCA